MPATSVRDLEISSHTGERPLDLFEVSEPELTRLLTWETTDQQEALDPIAWQMLQGAQNLRRWIWTVVLVALVLLVIGLFPPSPYPSGPSRSWPCLRAIQGCRGVPPPWCLAAAARADRGDGTGGRAGANVDGGGGDRCRVGAIAWAGGMFWPG